MRLAWSILTEWRAWAFLALAVAGFLSSSVATKALTTRRSGSGTSRPWVIRTTVLVLLTALLVTAGQAFDLPSRVRAKEALLGAESGLRKHDTQLKRALGAVLGERDRKTKAPAAWDRHAARLAEIRDEYSALSMSLRVTADDLGGNGRRTALALIDASDARVSLCALVVSDLRRVSAIMSIDKADDIYFLAMDAITRARNHPPRHLKELVSSTKSSTARMVQVRDLLSRIPNKEAPTGIQTRLRAVDSVLQYLSSVRLMATWIQRGDRGRAIQEVDAQSKAWARLSSAEVLVGIADNGSPPLWSPSEVATRTKAWTSVLASLGSATDKGGAPAFSALHEAKMLAR